MSLDKPRMYNIKEGVPSTIHKAQELRFSRISGSVKWYLLTEVLRKPIGPNVGRYKSTPRNTPEE